MAETYIERMQRLGLAPKPEKSRTVREILGDLVQSGIRYTQPESWNAYPGYAQGLAAPMAEVVENATPVGMLTSAQDIAPAYQSGDYLGAAIAALGAVPLPGGRAAKEGMEGAVKGIRALHASPHDFTEFRHDPSTARTGEGHAAYGEGLYFAENPKVSGRGGIYDKQFERKTGKPSHIYEVDILADPEKFLDWDRPLSEQKHVWEGISPEIRDAIDGVMDERGLAPMSEALDDYTGRELYQALKHYDVHESLPPELPGSSWMTGETDEARHTAAYLKSLGLPGIRFLDSGSRRNPVGNVSKLRSTLSNWEALSRSTPGEDYAKRRVESLRRELAEAEAAEKAMLETPKTRNYVVFDASHVQIVKKMGIAAALAAGLITEEMARQMQAQGIDKET